MVTVKRRVARGVKLLDEKVPGWDQRIRLHHLDMASGYKCVLGQLYGDYEHGVNALFGQARMLYATGTRYGFNRYWSRNFDPLDREWTRVISERRMKDIINDPATKAFVDAIRDDRLRLKVLVDA